MTRLKAIPTDRLRRLREAARRRLYVCPMARHRHICLVYTLISDELWARERDYLLATGRAKPTTIEAAAIAARRTV